MSLTTEIFLEEKQVLTTRHKRVREPIKGVTDCDT